MLGTKKHARSLQTSPWRVEHLPPAVPKYNPGDSKLLFVGLQGSLGRKGGPKEAAESGWNTRVKLSKLLARSTLGGSRGVESASAVSDTPPWGLFFLNTRQKVELEVKKSPPTILESLVRFESRFIIALQLRHLLRLFFCRGLFEGGGAQTGSNMLRKSTHSGAFETLLKTAACARRFPLVLDSVFYALEN